MYFSVFLSTTGEAVLYILSTAFLQVDEIQECQLGKKAEQNMSKAFAVKILLTFSLM